MSDTIVSTAAPALDESTPLATPFGSSPTDAPPSQPRRPRRSPRKSATCPDPGSLYDILRENCGTSLFVLPILWTDVHPRLLRAEFVAQEPVLSLAPTSDTDGRSSDSGSSPHGSRRSSQPRPSELAEALSYDLTSLLSPDDMRPFSKSRAIKNVLSTLFQTPFSRPKSAVDLDLHFGDRAFRKAVRIPVLWTNADTVGSSFDSAATRPVSSFGHMANGARETNDFCGPSFAHGSQGPPSSPSSPDGPIVAYVNRSHLATIRQNLFRIVPGPEGRYNGPVSRLQMLRSKQLIPLERDRDAYLLGVFLGMAQAHFYDNQSSRQAFWWNNRRRYDRVTQISEFHDVKLRILTHDDDTSDFIVYTTVVTASFLKRFAEPTKCTADVDESSMKIEFARVPVWPIMGLRERLGKALGDDLVGDALLQEASDLFSSGDDDDKDAKEEKASQDTLDFQDSPDVEDTEDVNNVEKETDAKARSTVTHAADEPSQRPVSLKRKRAERQTLTEMLVATLDTDSSSSGNNGKMSKLNRSGDDANGAAAVAVTAPMFAARKASADEVAVFIPRRVLSAARPVHMRIPIVHDFEAPDLCFLSLFCTAFY